ncbi:MAG TPA: phosphoribosyl-ATP diphosphatase [Cyanobacteria bacterium UBA11372]|nr:phosphoribosyl-ATP diphosphatase [Cyanobacteria bacterium UBA11372]
MNTSSCPLSDIYSKVVYFHENPQKEVHCSKKLRKKPKYIRCKPVEEASELAAAFQKDDIEEIIEEAGDLLYYTIILLVYREIELESVCDRILAKRFSS